MITGVETIDGRDFPAVGTRVRVYRNLQRKDAKWWSLQAHTGKDARRVVGYARGVQLADVTVGYDRGNWLKWTGRKRRVCAWVIGTIVDCGDHVAPIADGVSVRFDMHGPSGVFESSHDGAEFHGAERAVFGSDGSMTVERIK